MPSPSPIEIVAYDLRWPLQYNKARDEILSVIGEFVVAVEHIGSTAVPGLAAKPVIDILAAVRSLEDAPLFLPPLYPLGYAYIPEHEDVFPERRYLHRIISGAHTHHLHIVELSSEFWRVQLLFRDHLRSHPDDARRYADLKYQLADRFRHDREAYTDGKSEFIQNILNQSRAKN